MRRDGTLNGISPCTYISFICHIPNIHILNLTQTSAILGFSLTNIYLNAISECVLYFSSIVKYNDKNIFSYRNWKRGLYLQTETQIARAGFNHEGAHKWFL